MAKSHGSLKARIGARTLERRRQEELSKKEPLTGAELAAAVIVLAENQIPAVVVDGVRCIPASEEE